MRFCRTIVARRREIVKKMVLKFFKDWTLPIAMLAGIAGYPFFVSLSFLTPALIFVMLLLTFCRVSPKELKLEPLHLWLFLIQIFGSLAVYRLLAPFNKVVAEGAMVCVICPTATAAAVITARLGGNVASLTAYTLLGNLGAAVAVPVLFPLIESHPGVGFWTAFSMILGKIFPLLICPFLTAWLLSRLAPKMHRFLLERSSAAFYLWSVSLAIVTAQTFSSLLQGPSGQSMAAEQALAALAVCGLQFLSGQALGGLYGNRIAGGQALGQKNTVLAIWMAHTYLNPLSSIGPGAYVLWQNAVNSWQLWRKRRRDEAVCGQDRRWQHS